MLLIVGSAPAQTPGTTSEITVSLNKSVVLENPAGIRRVSVSNGELAEAVAVSNTELVVNGKQSGETSLVVWDSNGKRTAYDVHILPDSSRIDYVRQALKEELPKQDLKLSFNQGTVFLEGTVDTVTNADRAVAIASTLGKVINLLHVKVPKSEPQILLKVRFADVDRSAVSDLGANFYSPRANLPGSISTGQFGGPPSFDFTQQPYQYTIPNALNVFFQPTGLGFGAYLKLLQQKSLAQILAEPNLLTLSGHSASFLAGGEFPFPTLQGGGAGVGQITIQFREFGIRLNFLPTVTPRGTIRLSVEPEVSSLNPANGLTVGGYTIPGLDTRRVQTEVELENNQSLVIAGLLDNRVTETISKIPGLANIPLLGKLFESRAQLKNNTELLVVVTPEIVEPIPAGVPVPELKMPKEPLRGTSVLPPQNPPPPGPAGTLPKIQVLPVEEIRDMLNNLAPKNSAAPDAAPGSQPLLMPPSAAPPAPNSNGGLK